jgi:hypothetical protein
MARPQKEIDEKLVKKLAAIHCTMEEIAAVCECSVDTLERRFAEVIKDAKQQGKASLRRYLFALAEKNPTILIWLSKQYLGMKDKNEIDMTERAAKGLSLAYSKKPEPYEYDDEDQED